MGAGRAVLLAPEIVLVRTAVCPSDNLSLVDPVDSLLLLLRLCPLSLEA